MRQLNHIIYLMRHLKVAHSDSHQSIKTDVIENKDST